MTMPSFEESSRVRRSVRLTKKIFDLQSARAVLPLLRGILADSLGHRARLAHATTWLQRSQRRPQNRDVSRADRQRRYHAEDVQTAARAALQLLTEELRALEVTLLPDVGPQTVGFPTIVNGSLAYLVFRSEDEDIRYWRYCDQPKLRAIPPAWYGSSFEPVAEAEGLLT